MDQRIFHGNITPEQVAQALSAHFNRGNLRTQTAGNGGKVIVQIATQQFAQSGGKTALTVSIQRHTDGVQIQLGQQAWLGIAGSLAATAFSVFRNPLSLLGRLDDLAQDIESLRLGEEVWEVVNKTAESLGVNHELSERLARLTCAFCHTANPVGEPNCISCGAPLGKSQPRPCKKCGFISKPDEKNCQNCGALLE